MVGQVSIYRRLVAEVRACVRGEYQEALIEDPLTPWPVDGSGDATWIRSAQALQERIKGKIGHYAAFYLDADGTPTVRVHVYAGRDPEAIPWHNLRELADDTRGGIDTSGLGA